MARPVGVNDAEEWLLELYINQHGARGTVEVRGGAVGEDGGPDLV